ncbi:MAG TPA: NfeD family protein [Pirellulales bacterium]|nr:NfeD family protein [Pirellulales bacterium]
MSLPRLLPGPLLRADEPAEPAAAPRSDRPDNQPRVGKFLRIPGAVTDKVDQRIRHAVDIAVRQAKQHGQWPVFVLEIGTGRTEFGQAYDLARFLSSDSLNGATTVAFLPSSVTGHNVLIAMACDEIIMGPEAEIGEAGKFESSISPPMRNAYIEIANRRKTVPADLALGMLDAGVEVLEVETDVSREFVLASRLDELRKQKSFQSSKVVKPAGKPGLFTGRQGRELGFVSYLATERADVAKIWRLPREALQDDPSLDGQWRAARFYVKGPITPEAMNRLQTLLRSQIREQSLNFLCLWIDSPGGSPTDSMNLANFLASLESSQQRTVAYIPGEARGDAAFIALACDQIVMHPSATLGGAGAADISDDEVKAIESALDEICQQKSRNPALAAAMIDPKLTVWRCVRKTDGLVDFMTDEQLAARQREEAQPDLWRKEDEITRPGHALHVDGHAAEELGLASAVVENFADFKSLYHLEHDPQLLEPSWVTTLIDALNSPGVSWFLLFLGGAALYAELQSPGVGLGGIVGALCFLLYFWSAYLGGTAGWLEAVLFLAGIVCLLMEVFVFPGVAVFGLSGGLMVIAALVLASQTFILPHNEYQLAHLRTTLSVVVGAGVAALVAAVAMNRLLPHAPMFNRMLLAPPSGDELSEISQREATARFEHLVGQQGVAVTPLLPAGKARIGDELIDVLADREFIDRGQQVVVVQARANRVIVRPVI